MEGRLIKLGLSEGYRLDDLNGNYIASTLNGKNKLSLRNCEAVANGYDLDELINRAFDNMGYHSTVTPYEEKQFKLGYRIAFREALEILGDKKFSEEDIKRAFIQGVYTKAEIHRKKEEYIQSLQQTEWDVEILMGTHCRQINCVNKGELVKSKIVKDGEVPMLDKDGCLILKRK